MPGCSFTEIYRNISFISKGEVEQAKQLHANLLNFIQRWMSHCEYIIKVEKQILATRGIISHNYCRLPSFDVGENQIEVDEFMILLEVS
ncbi:hypothetical protein [Vibrio taketomensis]|uniref:hypothetical protein n=1 Tax=Vibrio taketomensis TaxID=2572923 RepID=UPI001E2FF327|nr:hypothetical protein [Vibrio taketomensis]